MTVLWLLAGLGVMVVAGLGLVIALWPRDEPLALDLALGLAWILGGLTVGAAMLALATITGLRGVPLLAVVSVISMTGPAVVAWPQVHARWPYRARPRLADVVATTLLILTACWLTSVTLRAHLGYDGTVVWHHKARLIVEAGGAAPLEALAQRTRVWAAPDYPLGVPSIWAWTESWTRVDDEQLAKLMPAAWAIATLLLVHAGVRAATGQPMLAALAVLMLATTPRLVVGEGSLTTGYADAPYAAVYLAAVLVAIRADWGRDVRWVPLLITVASLLPWVKQEGVVGAGILAGIVAFRTGRIPLVAPLLGPALAIHLLWGWLLAAAGASLTQAYAWPGLGTAWHRLPTIVGAYGEAVYDNGWGMLWPAIGVGLFMTRAGSRVPALMAIGLPVLAGAATFTLSTFPSLEEHLAVTAPRQLIQIAPMVVALIGGATLNSTTRGQKSQERKT